MAAQRASLLVFLVGQPDLHEFPPDGVANMPGRMDQLTVTWLTGSRTASTSLMLEPTEHGYRLTLTNTDRPGGGILIGYPRTVGIQLAAPVDASLVVFAELPD